MKKAAKVFIIIGMVVGFWMITPIIFGCIALKKLKNAREKSEITAISILTLIFCSTLGGIFMLCIPASDFPGKEEPQPAFNPYQQVPVQNMQYPNMQAMPQQNMQYPNMQAMPQQNMQYPNMQAMPQQNMQYPNMQTMPQQNMQYPNMQAMPQQNAPYTAPAVPQNNAGQNNGQ